jgi:uncharacterized membrane-anchored protein YhcB (DUF1043 family)
MEANMFWIGLIFGLIIGANLGFLVSGLLSGAKKQDEMIALSVRNQKT